MHFGLNFHNFAIDFVTICKKRFPSSLRNIAPSGRPSPPGMRHVLAPSHMPIHTLLRPEKLTKANYYNFRGNSFPVFWEGLWTMACSLYFYWGLDMSYAFQQDVVLLLSPILHRMLLFANLHPECRNKYRRAAVLPSPEGLQLKFIVKMWVFCKLSRDGCSLRPKWHKSGPKVT